MPTPVLRGKEGVVREAKKYGTPIWNISWKFEILDIFYALWYICPNVRIQRYTYNLYILIRYYVIQKHNKYTSFN